MAQRIPSKLPAELPTKTSPRNETQTKHGTSQQLEHHSFSSSRSLSFSLVGKWVCLIECPLFRNLGFGPLSGVGGSAVVERDRLADGLLDREDRGGVLVGT